MCELIYFYFIAPERKTVISANKLSQFVCKVYGGTRPMLFYANHAFSSPEPKAYTVHLYYSKRAAS